MSASPSRHHRDATTPYLSSALLKRYGISEASDTAQLQQILSTLKLLMEENPSAQTELSYLIVTERLSLEREGAVPVPDYMRYTDVPIPELYLTAGNSSQLEPGFDDSTEYHRHSEKTTSFVENSLRRYTMMVRPTLGSNRQFVVGPRRGVFLSRE